MKTKIIEEMKAKGLTGAQAEDAYKATFNALTTVINRDGEARVPGFGNFKKKFREGREARNPRTGEMVSVAAREVVTFKQSKAS